MVSLRARFMILAKVSALKSRCQTGFHAEDRSPPSFLSASMASIGLKPSTAFSPPFTDAPFRRTPV